MLSISGDFQHWWDSRSESERRKAIGKSRVIRKDWWGKSWRQLQGLQRVAVIPEICRAERALSGTKREGA